MEALVIYLTNTPKIEISELQAMNTERAKQLKTFSNAESSSSTLVVKEGCTNCKETNLIKSDLVNLDSKYNMLLAEYTKTKNILCETRKDLFNKKTKESNVKFIKCNECDLSFKTDSGLMVHTDLMHMNVPVNQDKLECSHCPKAFSDLRVMKKHNKIEHKFKCKLCPKTFK